MKSVLLLGIALLAIPVVAQAPADSVARKRQAAAPGEPFTLTGLRIP